MSYNMQLHYDHHYIKGMEVFSRRALTDNMCETCSVPFDYPLCSCAMCYTRKTICSCMERFSNTNPCKTPVFDLTLPGSTVFGCSLDHQHEHVTVEIGMGSNVVRLDHVSVLQCTPEFLVNSVLEAQSMIKLWSLEKPVKAWEDESDKHIFRGINATAAYKHAIKTDNVSVLAMLNTLVANGTYNPRDTYVNELIDRFPYEKMTLSAFLSPETTLALFHKPEEFAVMSGEKRLRPGQIVFSSLPLSYRRAADGSFHFEVVQSQPKIAATAAAEAAIKEKKRRLLPTALFTPSPAEAPKKVVAVASDDEDGSSFGAGEEVFASGSSRGDEGFKISDRERDAWCRKLHFPVPVKGDLRPSIVRRTLEDGTPEIGILFSVPHAAEGLKGLLDVVCTKRKEERIEGIFPVRVNDTVSRLCQGKPTRALYYQPYVEEVDLMKDYHMDVQLITENFTRKADGSAVTGQMRSLIRENWFLESCGALPKQGGFAGRRALYHIYDRETWFDEYVAENRKTIDGERAYQRSLLEGEGEGDGDVAVLLTAAAPPLRKGKKKPLAGSTKRQYQHPVEPEVVNYMTPQGGNGDDEDGPTEGEAEMKRAKVAALEPPSPSKNPHFAFLFTPDYHIGIEGSNLELPLLNE